MENIFGKSKTTGPMMSEFSKQRQTKQMSTDRIVRK